MGGNAFTSGPSPLSTPRMPPSLYDTLRHHYLSLLSNYYTSVATPVEAPSKSSYGDIDILVSEPKDPILNTNSLASPLSAARTFHTSSSPITSFAIPYPGRADAYVQLDVHLCPSGTFKWQLFHQSHGDLWNLLGTTIRPFGLTVNDVGLHLRIPEIEEVNRKRGMLFLTDSPDEVLDFLGLDADVYAQPFSSVEALYEFVVSCRFFRGSMYVREDLKANDRKRMNQRDLYRRFVDDWLPNNTHFVKTHGEKYPGLMKEDVQEVALKRWSKKEEYEMKVEDWRRERRELLDKQEGRLKRKADAVEVEEYVNAWTTWLNHGRFVE